MKNSKEAGMLTSIKIDEQDPREQRQEKASQMKMYLAEQIESKNKLGKEDKFFGMTNEEILYNKATLKQMGFLK